MSKYLSNHAKNQFSFRDEKKNIATKWIKKQIYSGENIVPDGHDENMIM